MINFSPKLQDATEKELMNIVNESDPTHASLASDELTRRSIKQLNETIIREVEQSKKTSETTEVLSRAMYLFAVVQILISIFQFILSFAYTNNIKLMTLGMFMSLIISLTLIFISSKLPSKDN